MKAVGTFVQGFAAHDAGKFTRATMKLNARHVGQDSVAEQDRIRRDARLQMGQQLVDQGGSGFAVGTGSALDALRESAIERELDILTVRRKATLEQQGLKVQGQLAYNQGKSAMYGGIISGAAMIAEDIATAGQGGPKT